MLAALAVVAWAPCLSLAEGAAHELLRGGLQVRATPESLKAAGATARSPALNAPPPARKPASDPGAELRTQGELRRDAFRLLLGTD
jgi:hypothetical protein